VLTSVVRAADSVGAFFSILDNLDVLRIVKVHSTPLVPRHCTAVHSGATSTAATEQYQTSSPPLPPPPRRSTSHARVTMNATTLPTTLPYPYSHPRPHTAQGLEDSDAADPSDLGFAFYEVTIYLDRPESQTTSNHPTASHSRHSLPPRGPL
jgi:hypothetical protein